VLLHPVEKIFRFKPAGTLVVRIQKDLKAVRAAHRNSSPASEVAVNGSLFAPAEAAGPAIAARSFAAA
jgi:hypothetical protein